uniref:Protein spinster 1 n=2 Tax=Ascaris TaxID=6251 RepID=F1L4Q1_ASCSU
MFIVFYMIFAPLCGFLGDRYNRKWIMTVGIAIWVLAVFASSFVPANMFWLFLLLRGIVGVGEASYATIAPTIIADMFLSAIRSRVLMFFYFAIPVGSGLGYMVGSYVSSWFGSWNWGIRVTPVLGIVCLFSIIFVIKEPKRGEIEVAKGMSNASGVTTTSYLEDLKALCKIPTYINATLAYTSVVFVTGTLSWWGPTGISHAFAIKEGLNSTELLSDDEKDRINFIFGVITMIGGFVGVSVGTALAQIWSNGKCCCRSIKSARANPLVCALGSAIGVPFLFFALHLIQTVMNISWVFMFLTITALCLNWSINVEILLDVVTPQRRSVANSWQILISHLLGDASGPYIIGLVSDAIRGSDTTPKAHFDALVNAFYIPNVILVISAILFIAAAVFFIRDKRKFQQQMGYSNMTGDVSYDGNEVQIKSIKGIDNKAFS